MSVLRSSAEEFLESGLKIQSQIKSTDRIASEKFFFLHMCALLEVTEVKTFRTSNRAGH